MSFRFGTFCLVFFGSVGTALEGASPSAFSSLAAGAPAAPAPAAPAAPAPFPPAPGWYVDGTHSSRGACTQAAGTRKAVRGELQTGAKQLRTVQSRLQ